MELCLLTEDDFIRRAPLCGASLFAQLDVWKLGKRGKSRERTRERERERENSCGDLSLPCRNLNLTTTICFTLTTANLTLNADRMELVDMLLWSPNSSNSSDGKLQQSAMEATSGVCQGEKTS